MAKQGLRKLRHLRPFRPLSLLWIGGGCLVGVGRQKKMKGEGEFFEVWIRHMAENVDEEKIWSGRENDMMTCDVVGSSMGWWRRVNSPVPLFFLNYLKTPFFTPRRVDFTLFLHFFSNLFGHLKKKYYLCTAI